MKITSKIILSLSFILICLNAKAQETENVETLLVNEWTLKSFEVNGQIFPPRERNKNDKMIFNSDKSAESISTNQVQKGTWSYDKTSQIILVVDEKNKFDMQLKLITITKSECTLELENPKGTFVKLNMTSKIE
ncbi:lipocalin family protein [Flavobacterium sp. PL002]|uniref:lipocalin family protein n=1 Tax=Flavobacterium sp. PL002 TaxID=1897058 RepID=UPI001787AD2A|nr:lipocalin family protein [Flavobacterium sp. PL002]MBE0393881.1 hypothetical protein [Flavobacterium sp. PL002]